MLGGVVVRSGLSLLLVALAMTVEVVLEGTNAVRWSACPELGVGEVGGGRMLELQFDIASLVALTGLADDVGRDGEFRLDGEGGARSEAGLGGGVGRPSVGDTGG